MSSAKTLMTVADYALHRKCSDSYVRRMRRSNRLVMDGDLIDVAASDRLLSATTDPVRGGDRTQRNEPEHRYGAPQSPAGGDRPARDPESDFVAHLGANADLRRAMARERDAKAKLAELDLGERAGQLIRKREAASAVFTLARQAMNRMRTMGSRLANQLAAAATPHECRQLIDAEIAQICADMQQASNDMLATEQSDATTEAEAA